MRAWLRKWWPWIKGLTALAILGAVGWRFWRDLSSQPDLWELSVRPGWVALSGVLYILGLGCSNLYWYRLLRLLGEKPPIAASIRTYFLSHLGKYLPGKGLALLMRTTLAGEAGVRLGIAAMTTFYEVLLTMAVGMLLALLLFLIALPAQPFSMDWSAFRGLLRLETPLDGSIDRQALIALSLLLLAIVGIPIIPGIFNRLVQRVFLPFRKADAAPLPRLGLRACAEGCLVTAGNWLFLGASFGCMLQAVLTPPPAWSWSQAERAIAFMALAYVAGFVILLVPSGLGVREFFLTLCLAPEIRLSQGASENEARALAVLIVLLLRLTWTAAEVVVVALVYWLPVRGAGVRNQGSGFSQNN